MYTKITENKEWVFEHKNIHKYTWEKHTKNLKNIIEYIITKQVLRLKIQDVRAYRGPNCGTDHKLVVAKILFPYRYTTKDKHEEKTELKQCDCSAACWLIMRHNMVCVCVRNFQL